MTEISKELKGELMKDFPVFAEACKKFYAKELAPGQYKGISGGFGSYAERGYETGMLRLRFPGGLIGKQQMDFLLKVIAEYKLQDIHFTTGQNIQVHHLPGETILDLYQQAADYGIYCRGGGGDFPRNISASPLRGVEAGEYFNIAPYVTAASQYILTLVTTLQLPRKYKIGFSSGVDNEGHATFKDLGFLATPEGKFDVYAAGGLGPNAKLGTLVATGVEPKDILYHIHALGHLFSEHGNYKNRAHNRTRYLPMDMGSEAFVALYQEYLAKAKTLALTLEDLAATTLPELKAEIAATSNLAKPQVQAGYYYVHYHPLAGMVNKEVFTKLLTFVAGTKAGEIRLNTDESAYIVNLTGPEADAVAKIIAEDTATNDFEATVTCVGATVCQVGIQDSQGLLVDLVKKLKSAKVNTDYLPQMHISGCPSSCGTHQIGSIGLHGFVKKVNGEPKPAFKIFAGGKYVAKQEKLSQEYGLVAVEDMEALFTDLANTLNAAKENFVQWYSEDPERFATLVAKYA